MTRLLVLGDSLAQSGYWNVLRAAYDMQSLAHGGEKIAALEKQIAAAAPADVALVSCGINDVRAGGGHAEILEGLDAALAKLREKTNAIVFLGLPHIRGADAWNGEIDRINAGLKTMPGVRYVATDWSRPTCLFRRDELHFNALTYTILIACVTPVLRSASRAPAPRA